ncbi:hypothetical protein [Dactylosporangium sp. NPDC049140]|uniref:hypothetical protein n=1 Tax=Dactylosporangium sp. NPDC049140 TaxID=3155647 RepID=UPI0033D41E71
MSETHAPAGGCCGNPPAAPAPSPAAGAPCCGTTAEAAAENSCCGSTAKAGTVAAGQGCCA